MGMAHYLPAQSPPAPNMFQQHQVPMPPRPRPEGGQDNSPPFLDDNNPMMANGGGGHMGQDQPLKPKQGELVIGAWNAEEEMAKDNMQHQV